MSEKLHPLVRASLLLGEAALVVKGGTACAPALNPSEVQKPENTPNATDVSSSPSQSSIETELAQAIPSLTPTAEFTVQTEIANPPTLQDQDPEISLAEVFVGMGTEEFNTMFGSGGEENKNAIAEWVKTNWNLGDKDIVTLSGDNGYVTVDRYDEETRRREVKFYSLITGEKRFDTNVAEYYANNNWESDPEWQPTPVSRVTVMGRVEGLPFDIPISIGAVQSSDIKRIVPSQHLADALARGYLEAYKARYEMQQGTELSWGEYLLELQKGQGAPTVPQLNEDEQSYYKYTKDSQFNPLAGVAIVYVDSRVRYANLPVKVAVPGLTLKNHIDENGRLVIMVNIAGTSIEYHLAKGEAMSSGAGNVTAEEIFTTVITSFPARIISSGPDSCLRDNSTGSIECRDIFFSEESDQFIKKIESLTVEARKQGTLTESLLKDFQHAIPPQRR